jgi:hypothetical protein
MKTIKLISAVLFAPHILFQSALLQAAPHVHGEAELTIAMEADRVQVQFMAPASDVVGFEHSATSPEQQQTLNNARDILSESTNVFVFTGGECEISKINIDMSGLENTKHDAHEHESTMAHDHQHAHPNITATYDFNCRRLQQLSSLNMNVFDVFPTISRVNGMWVSEHLQGSKVLSIKDRQLRFK